MQREANERARAGGTSAAGSLPVVDPMTANPEQRLFVVIALRQLLAVKRGEPFELQRLRVAGSAGVGKSHVVNIITRAAWRLFGNKESARNLAPTAKAGELLPAGSTTHSFTHPPISADKLKGAFDGAPLGREAVKHLRNRVGVVPRVTRGAAAEPVTAEELQAGGEPAVAHARDTLRCFLVCLDEISMWTHALLGWTSHRFSEATGMAQGEASFGGVPVVCLFGDHGQLPSQGAGVHVAPGHDASQAGQAGWTHYRYNITETVVLTQMMRQAPEEAEWLELLLAFWSGRVTQQHWQLLNSRVEDHLPAAERADWATRRRLTLFETWKEARAHNKEQIRALRDAAGQPVPVACIPATDNDRRPRIEGDAGQLPAVCVVAVGMRAVLTKNQCGGRLGQAGASNGAAGIVVAILYAQGQGPPSLPIAILLHIPTWKGPVWIAGHPTWVPSPFNESRDDQKNLSRKGMPINAGWATVVHKAQGKTIGEGQAVERMRAVITDDVFMEAHFLGCQYVALSRCKRLTDFALAHAITWARACYVNGHVQMDGRRAEDARLLQAAQETLRRYQHLICDLLYAEMWRQLDVLAADGICDAPLWAHRTPRELPPPLPRAQPPPGDGSGGSGNGGGGGGGGGAGGDGGLGDGGGEGGGGGGRGRGGGRGGRGGGGGAGRARGRGGGNEAAALRVAQQQEAAAAKKAATAARKEEGPRRPSRRSGWHKGMRPPWPRQLRCKREWGAAGRSQAARLP